MHELNADSRRFIELVGSQMLEYLETEVGIKTSTISNHFFDIQRLNLNYLTSIMAVEGQLQIMFAFSFEQKLANKIMKAYIAELDIDGQVPDEYIEETAADVINIVLGNTLGHFQIAGKAIELTPPIVITEAKTIYRNKPAQFLTADIRTKSGDMQICCIGPKELFDKELNYIEEME